MTGFSFSPHPQNTLTESQFQSNSAIAYASRQRYSNTSHHNTDTTHQERRYQRSGSRLETQYDYYRRSQSSHSRAVRVPFRHRYTCRDSDSLEERSNTPMPWQPILGHWDKSVGPIWETLTHELIARGANELKEIFEIWEECCEESRRTGGGAPPNLVFQPEHDDGSESERRVFEAIVDRFSAVFPFYDEKEGIRFLDLGCRPGGFASFVMRNDLKATGVGIASPLPPEDSNVEESQTMQTVYEKHYATFGSRFSFHFYDISKLESLCSSTTQESPHSNTDPDLDKMEEGQCEDETLPDSLKFLQELRTKEVECFSPNHKTASTPITRKFNLIFIDAIPSTSQEDDNDLLLISQLLFALQSISLSPGLRPRAGGTLIIRLTHLESVKTAKILYMLDIVSGTVATLKPRDMDVRGDPGSFYAIAQDIGGGPHGHKLFEIIEEFRRLWRELMLGKGVNGVARTRIGPRDLDFLIYTEDIRDGDYLNRLVSLGEMVWMRQLEMILLGKKKLSEVD